MQYKCLNMKWFKVFIVITGLIFIHPLTDKSQNVCAQAPVLPSVSSTTAAPNNKKVSTVFHSTERKLQYIGNQTGLIQFTNQISTILQNYTASLSPAIFSGAGPNVADSGLVVLVDTNQVFGVTEANTGGTINNTTVTYDGYPVIIKNISNKNLAVGSGTIIPVTLEALDSENNWRTVESNSLNVGTAINKIILKPGHVAGVVVPVYTGSFKTLMRIRVFDNYSSSFTVYLNHSQLTEPVK